MSSNTPTPDWMQTNSPQGEHWQARLDTFKQSVQIALDEPLKESCVTDKATTTSRDKIDRTSGWQLLKK